MKKRESPLFVISDGVADTSWECEQCVARRYCAWFEDETIEEEAEKALEDRRKENE